MSNAVARIANDTQIEADAGSIASRVAAKFPKECSQEQALEVARVAVAYGLDPFLGELIPYQGRPYITIEGRIRIADNHPSFDGYDLEPASESEAKALRVNPDQESVWKATVYRKDRRRPTVAFGRAGGQAETNPVARRWLPEIAQKRALHRALRAAFPVPIPGLEENLSPSQLQAIHAVDNEYGVSRDERHADIVDMFDVDSSAELTKEQASAYIELRQVNAADEAAMDGDIIDVESESIERSAQREELIEQINQVASDGGLNIAKRIAADEGFRNDERVKSALRDAQKRLQRTSGASPIEDVSTLLPIK